MGNRLTQIATRTGDDGTTGLGDNTRVSKDSLRVHAMGEVDELNSHIGLLLCEDMPDAVRQLLVTIQHELFNLGGELSIPGFELLKPQAVLDLDQALQEHNAVLPKLQEFILPAGTRAAALAHVCRTVARRSERAVVALGAQDALKDTPRQYLNRLSDLMFVLARVLNRHRTDGSTGDDVRGGDANVSTSITERISVNFGATSNSTRIGRSFNTLIKCSVNSSSPIKGATECNAPASSR